MAGSEVQSVPSEPIFGKKFMSKLGGMANESAASTVSEFARRQMEKMGWKEGKGLGKEEQGVVTHVRVKKREESMGIGVEKLNVEEQKNQWWYNAYDKIADKIKIAPDSDDENGGDAKSQKKSKKKASKKKRKRDAEVANGVDADAAREKKFRIPTDEELFAATGGKLFGRRAYGSCNGKLKRDELLQSGKFEHKEKKSKKEQDTTSSSSNNSSENEKKDDKTAKKKSKDKKRKSSKKSKELEERSDSQ
uniref:G-patch domain-containing protein n=1 Tax=Globisporangium ultimum (strain ATCC 200006 / CBS 805.95 / DAOM BR144) TaxID=431595 RepID=K3WD65_GLOUD